MTLPKGVEDLALSAVDLPLELEGVQVAVHLRQMCLDRLVEML